MHKPSPSRRSKIAELADGIVCLDLIGAALSIDVWEAVKKKFNRTSGERGFQTVLV